MELKFNPATRKAVPLIVGISGPSGSGKTLSSMLMAAGLAGPDGYVRLLDTENGRGLFYADDPLIRHALPQGFEHIDFPAPFSPARYIDQIDDAERAGVQVLVVDSGSHEWEGPGGCTEMAEQNRGRWNKPKIAHRKFMYRLIYSGMHIIVCLRAREKSKILPKEQSPSGKEEVISLGMLPICEKGFMFELLVSLTLEEKTNHVIPVKVPAPLRSIFRQGQLLSKEHGELLREWNNGGAPIDRAELLQKRARAAAENGMAEYSAFFAGLTKEQRGILASTTHAANKKTAERADMESRQPEDGLSADNPEAILSANRSLEGAL